MIVVFVIIVCYFLCLRNCTQLTIPSFFFRFASSKNCNATTNINFFYLHNTIHFFQTPRIATGWLVYDKTARSLPKTFPSIQFVINSINIHYTIRPRAVPSWPLPSGGKRFYQNFCFSRPPRWVLQYLMLLFTPFSTSEKLFSRRKTLFFNTIFNPRLQNNRSDKITHLINTIVHFSQI